MYTTDEKLLKADLKPFVTFYGNKQRKIMQHNMLIVYRDNKIK